MTLRREWDTINTSDINIIICSAGYEDRSKGLIDTCPTDLVPDICIINVYLPMESTLFNGNLKTLEEIRRFWINRGVKKIHVIQSNPLKPESFIEEIKLLLIDKFINHPSILIDITSFTRLYLFELLSLLYKQAQLTVIYTEPLDFTRNLPKGNKDIMIAPSLRGIPDQDLEVRLVLLLGWEGERAQALVDLLDPDYFVPILGIDESDETHVRWNEVAREVNNALLSSTSMIERLPTLNPDGVKNGLTKLYQTKWMDSNLVISCMGPKPQCIGIFEFARNNPRVQVLCTIPQAWCREDEDVEPPLSNGIGSVYIYHVWD